MRQEHRPCSLHYNRHVLVTLAACSMLLLVPVGLQAFAIFSRLTFGGEVHQEMTRAALSAIAVNRPSLGLLTFDDGAIAEIVAANVEVDRHQGRPEYHFDNQSLDGGSNRIKSLKTLIIGLLQRQSPLTDHEARQVRETIGHALHTLQDFYSHSNWVNFNGSSLNMALGNVPSPLPVFATRSLPNCAPDTSTLVATKLITGYALGDLDLISAPVGECGHGLVGNGIHKDWDGRPFHVDAFRAALFHSLEFVRDDLFSVATNEESLCKVLRSSAQDCEQRVYLGSFQIFGVSVIGNCILDEVYTISDAKITLDPDGSGNAFVPVFFNYNVRDPSICSSSTESTYYVFPIQLSGQTFTSRLTFSGARSFYTELSGEVGPGSISGTLTFVRTGGQSGFGTVTGPFVLPRQ